MKQEQLDNLKEWFDSYVADFYCDEKLVDDNIELKDVHSKAHPQGKASKGRQ